MEKLSLPRGWAWGLALYASLAAAGTVLQHQWVDLPSAAQRHQAHQLVLSGQAPAPYQYRLLVPYLAQGLMRCGWSFDAAYGLIFFLSTLLAGALLHGFLRRWFDDTVCLVGTLFFYSILPMTFLYSYYQPMDEPNLAFTLAALFLIRERRDAPLALTLALAALNRETPVLLPLLWLLYRWDELPLESAVARFLALLAAPLFVYLGLRAVIGPRPYYTAGVSAVFNALQVQSYVFPAIMFGVPGALAAKGWSRKPKFVRRAVLFAPFWAVFHFIVAVFPEMRLHLPLIPVLLPAALASGWTPAPEAAPETRAPRWLKGMAKPLYFAGLLAIGALAWAYGARLGSQHEGYQRPDARLN